MILVVLYTSSHPKRREYGSSSSLLYPHHNNPVRLWSGREKEWQATQQVSQLSEDVILDLSDPILSQFYANHDIMLALFLTTQ